ncbi:hypothetical protein EON64_02660, partial [archaeon]
MTTMDSFLKSVFDFNVPLQNFLPPLETLPPSIPIKNAETESEDDIFRTVQPSWREKYWGQVHSGRKFPWTQKLSSHGQRVK